MRPNLSAPVLLAAALASLCLLDTSAAQTSGPHSWIGVDSAARTVTLTLETSTVAGEASAQLNGFRAGAVQLVVPLDWTVVWNWRNADSAAVHSLVVMQEREKIPVEGGRPAFDNAMTRAVTAGLKPGSTDRTTFLADQAGWYWLLCGVSGHALAGEWIGLKVDAGVSTPSVNEK
jgi:uncharacterized cupredoxin-like copper-binding protein